MGELSVRCDVRGTGVEFEFIISVGFFFQSCFRSRRARGFPEFETIWSFGRIEITTSLNRCFRGRGPSDRRLGRGAGTLVFIVAPDLRRSESGRSPTRGRTLDVAEMGSGLAESLVTRRSAEQLSPGWQRVSGALRRHSQVYSDILPKNP